MAEKKTTKKAAEKKPEKIYKKVDCARLNIRAEASLNADKVGILEKGAKVEILGEKDGFYQIKEGYVKAEFVK